MKISLGNLTFLIGLILASISFTLYYVKGYSLQVLFIWFFSILILGYYFFLNSLKEKQSVFNLYDIGILTLLLIIFIPIYLAFIYAVPFQINTDEIVIMDTIKKAVNTSNPDIFGLAKHYFYTPSLIFLIYGWVANLIGGINLLNIRFIHALFGIAIIAISYLYFRLGLPKAYALAGALILGFNHALIGISRMAMRDNSALFIEILSLFFLLKGFIQRSVFYSFLGGLVCGLSFYVYFPGRLTIFIWFLFIFLNLIFFKFLPRPTVIKISLISLLGIATAAIPILINTFRVPPNVLHYQKEQILLFEEGKKMQKFWIGAKSIEEAVKQNIINGLTTFNNNKSDYSYIYPNPGHGFVDPLSGVLIWIGFLGLILKRKKQEIDVLTLSAFLFIVFTFSFITNKAPNFTRLLIVLPFTTYLVVAALKRLKSFFDFLISASDLKFISKISLIFVIIIILIINLWNLAIFGNFAKKGLLEGNDVGGTARYIEAREKLSDYSFYLAANKSYPYYSWGSEYSWKTWVSFFALPTQVVKVIDPTKLPNEKLNSPFTLFLSEKLWQEKKDQLISAYPQYKLHFIKTNGSLLAFEVN